MLDISKSTGTDDINARMLKELAVVISKPLSMCLIIHYKRVLFHQNGKWY